MEADRVLLEVSGDVVTLRPGTPSKDPRTSVALSHSYQVDWHSLASEIDYATAYA